MSILSENGGPHFESDATRVVIALTARERSLFFEDGSIPAGTILRDAEFDPDGWEALLERLRPEVVVSGWSTPPIPERWLRRADCSLRYVCHVAGSVRALVPRSFVERGGVVTNWGDAVSAQVAEHALLLALAALRHADRWENFIARDASVRRIEEIGTRTLFGRRVGIHGFGAVARALLPLLAPFGVRVSAYSAGVPEALMRGAGVQPCRSLDDLFASSEVLFECEALTPATEKSVTAELLAALPDDAVFVNVGRGLIVDDAALQREAQSGRLRLALDVIADEPATKESAFVRSGNVILSPHIGGPTLDRYRQCGALALANLAAFLRGERPAAAITLAAYDRAT
jgi:Phosphoglycerate dehydrogenase and related dehydrogenases